jgi:hypothetical protein
LELLKQSLVAACQAFAGHMPHGDQCATVGNTRYDTFEKPTLVQHIPHTQQTSQHTFTFKIMQYRWCFRRSGE